MPTIEYAHMKANCFRTRHGAERNDRQYDQLSVFTVLRATPSNL